MLTIKLIMLFKYRGYQMDTIILKLLTLLLLKALTVGGFKLIGINDRYRHIEEKMTSFDLPSCVPIFERWIHQKLDHFDINETRMWKMRYYERLNFWTPNGPIYLIIGDEKEARTNKLIKGTVYELAKETKGAMYLSEHRYYGKSQPINWANYSVEDLKYLSASQSLADNAMLLRSIKENVKYKNSRVVVVGGSYAGNLAAWMKLMYPDLVDAVIASSAPVMAKRDFYEYLEIVGRDFKKYGITGCLDIIKNKFQRYHSLFQSEQGVNQLKEEENICEHTNINKPENRQLFFLTKTAAFTYVSQYGNVKLIKDHCLKLMNGSLILPPVKDSYLWDVRLNCFDFDFDKSVQAYKHEKNHTVLSWTYQSCTEFGYFKTTESDDQPFTKNIPVEFYDKLCTALFGEAFNKSRNINGIKITNNIFSSKSLNVSKIIFVNGELDPWSSLGILEDISCDAPAVYIPRASHCKDLSAEEKNDHVELKQARAHIKYLIKKWIGAI